MAPPAVALQKRIPLPELDVPLQLTLTRIRSPAASSDGASRIAGFRPAALPFLRGFFAVTASNSASAAALAFRSASACRICARRALLVA